MTSLTVDLLWPWPVFYTIRTYNLEVWKVWCRYTYDLVSEIRISGFMVGAVSSPPNWVLVGGFAILPLITHHTSCWGAVSFPRDLPIYVLSILFWIYVFTKFNSHSIALYVNFPSMVRKFTYRSLMTSQVRSQLEC